MIDAVADNVSPARNTVLVIEDTSPVRRALKKMLIVEGYDVIEARDGTEAVRYYGEHADRIVAATLDLMMPNTDGRELLAMLSAYAPRLPIVISTALNPPENLLGRVPGSPGVGYLQKPYTAQEFSAELRRVIAEMQGRG